jgi:flagellar hook-basal body complex protein FliE
MQIPAIGTGGVTGVSGVSGVGGVGSVGSVGGVGGVGGVTGSSSGSGGFGSMLSGAISSLNQSQNTAAADSTALATGQASDVTSVVSEIEKASLEMQLAVQVRNKAVDAYQEIMRMQV